MTVCILHFTKIFLKFIHIKINFVLFFVGYDFTTAVSSKGTVYVWGRNYKGHLGVESSVSASVSRKIVFKTAKGPSKTIEVAGDSPCIPRPTKFPSLVAFALTGLFSRITFLVSITLSPYVGFLLKKAFFSIYIQT